MKKIFTIFVVLYAILFSSLTVFANEENDIKNFINSSVTEFSAISKIDNAKHKKEKIKNISNKIVDLKWMGNFILGKYRKILTEKEINDFIDLYSNYLIDNYLNILFIINENNYIINTVDNQKENIYFVNMDINYEDKKANNVFRIVKKDNKYFITDIIMEGVSFVSIQRTDVISRLDTIGYNNFMEEIKNKNFIKNATK